MPTTLAPPTLSQICAWHTEHLNEAAMVWTHTADQWDDTFTRLARHIISPGGNPWNGDGAEAAQLRVNRDLSKARALADALRAAATIARVGERDLYLAKRAVVNAVRDAQSAGFEVNEDFSVTSRAHGGPPAVQLAQQAQAQELANDIRSRARVLVALDDDIGARVIAAASGLGTIGLETNVAASSSRYRRRRSAQIHLVDRTFGQNPVPDPSPGGGSSSSPVPTAQNIQDAIKDLPSGTKDDIRLLRDPDQLRQFEQWVMQNSREYSSPTPYRGGQGVQRQLADGTIVGFGPSTKFGPTSDIRIADDEVRLPSGPLIKLHVDTAMGGVMNFPAGVQGAPPPLEAAPPPAPPSVPRVEPNPKGGGAPLGRLPGIGGPGGGAGSLGPGVGGGGGGGLVMPSADPFHEI